MCNTGADFTSQVLAFHHLQLHVLQHVLLALTLNRHHIVHSLSLLVLNLISFLGAWKLNSRISFCNAHVYSVLGVRFIRENAFSSDLSTVVWVTLNTPLLSVHLRV